MEIYDVIIVGAGPAGSIAAKGLAKQGHNVLMIDKAKFPRNKVCAAGLTEDVMKLHPELEKYTFNKYSRVQIYSGDYAYPLRYEGKDRFGYQTTREHFDYMLVKDAISAGAVFKERQKAIDVQIDSEKIIVKTETDLFYGKIILGADGAAGIVARKTGLKKAWKKNEIATNLRVEVELPEDVILKYVGPEYILSFCGRFNGTPGIGYIFPKRNHLNVGMCTLTPDRLPLKDLLIAYIKKSIEMGLIPEFTPTNFGGAIYPICGPLKKIFTNRTLILGDAAGFVNPFDGEGIYLAIYSGDIAADVISRALKAGDLSKRFLKEYQKRCMKAFGDYLKKAKYIAKMVWKHVDTFVKYAPYSQNLVRLYHRVLCHDPHLLWTVVKILFLFIGAFFKYHFKRVHGLMPIVQI